MGAALMKMVALHTNRQEKKIDTMVIDDILSGAILRIQDDASAFDRVMRAYKLPKSTDEEKAIRKNEIIASLRVAADIPLSVMRDAVRLGRVLVKIVEVCDKGILSDITVAAYMLDAAFHGAGANVRINAISLKDEGKVYLSMSKALEEEWGPLYRKILSSIWWRENEK
jgi:formiminotetrahydrofolate cyclodeaminase